MILPTVQELAPLPQVDSRGLARGAFPGDNAPKGSGLIRFAHTYLAAPDAEKAPCHNCGKAQPVVMTLARPLDGRPYTICPDEEQDNGDCLARALARSAARRAAAEAALAAKDAAEAAAAAKETAKEEAEPKPAAKPRSRAERVTQAAQAKAEPPKGDGDATG